jgi:hypothetical protein
MAISGLFVDNVENAEDVEMWGVSQRFAAHCRLKARQFRAEPRHVRRPFAMVLLLRLTVTVEEGCKLRD